MKLLVSNGLQLEARDVGDIMLRLYSTAGRPLPILNEIISDTEARDKIRDLLATGHYEIDGSVKIERRS